MTTIDKLKEYSKTTPLVAILTRSPNTSMVLSFDPNGHATMFVPFCASAQSCVFFGFKAQKESTGIEGEEEENNEDETTENMLGCQLFEEFPAMTSEDAISEIRKHWNTFRITVLRCKARTLGIEMVRPSVLGVSGGLNDFDQTVVLRRSSRFFSEGELSTRFSELRQSRMTSQPSPSLTSRAGRSGGGNSLMSGENGHDLSQILEELSTKEKSCTSSGNEFDQMTSSLAGSNEEIRPRGHGRVYSTDRSSRSNSTISIERYTLISEENISLRKELEQVKEENRQLREKLIEVE